VPGVPDPSTGFEAGPPSHADGIERERLSREQLIATLQSAFPDCEDLHRELEIVVLQRIATQQAIDAYALQIGSWRIDLPVRLAQSAASAAILTGAIAITGDASVPVAVLALVLPFLVDIDRVEVRTRDRIVLAHLQDEIDLTDPESTYRRLPEDLREQLTLLEFADTLDRLRAARLIPDGRAVSIPLPQPASAPSAHKVPETDQQTP
jgi:hypothetical protein